MKVRVYFDSAATSYKVTDAAGVSLPHPLTKDPFEVDLTARSGTSNVTMLPVSFAGNTYVEFSESGDASANGTVTVVA